MNNPIEANPSLEKPSLHVLDALLRIGGPIVRNDAGAARTPQNFLGQHVVESAPLFQVTHNSSLHIPHRLLANLDSLLSMNLTSLLPPSHHHGGNTMARSFSQHERQGSMPQESCKDMRVQSQFTRPSQSTAFSPLVPAASPSVYEMAAGNVPRPGSGVHPAGSIDRFVVRKDKVAEALCSKPQRGKKRDDLSEGERLELTRTRNREHAKSTRQRKKARYQELLDHEEMFLRHQSRKNLQSDRIKSIHMLLNARQQKLIDGLLGNVIQQNEENSPTDSEQNTPNISDWNVCFDSLVPGDSLVDSQGTCQKLSKWDKGLQSRIRSFLKNESIEPRHEDLASLRYQIDGDDDGIAFSQNDTAFCRVSLSIEVPRSAVSSALESRQRREMLCAVCHFKFSHGTANIVSTSWTTLVDHFTQDQVRTCSESDGALCKNASPSDGGGTRQWQGELDALESQYVHPSTVSLDRVKNSQDEGGSK